MDKRIYKVLIATTNRGKFSEIAKLFAGLSFDLVSLTDLGIDSDVPEIGSSLEENAVIKAEAYSRLSGMLTLADDSGLEVGVLDGEPGVRSARYAGCSANDEDRITFLIKKLKVLGGNQWEARFRCVIAIAHPEKSTTICSGECPGFIVDEPRGDHGFGYDPVFFIPELGKTMAELTLDEKNLVSHRAQAVQRAIDLMTRMPR